MVSERKISKLLRPTKFVLLAVLFVTVIVLLNTITGLSDNMIVLLHRRLSDNIWRTTDVNNVTTTEEMFTLETLQKDPTMLCFERYELEEIETTDSSTSLEKSAAKKKLSYFNMLLSFNTIMSSLNIRVAVIEPSILHCLLEPEYKYFLAKRKFNIDNFTKPNKIITYGIFGEDVVRLQEEDNIRKFRSNGFQPYFSRSSPASWMLENTVRQESEKFTSHVFYSYYGWDIHVVVFHKRNSYLWQSGLNSENCMNIPEKKDLLFVNHDSAFENFAFIPLDTKSPILSSDFYIPSSSHYFLFQLPSSRFLECNLTRAVNVVSSTTASSSSIDKFKNRTLIGLHELKALFKNLLMNYWIFSGTMLGWYRQCDIIPYTSDVDFGAWASEIEDLDYIIQYLLKNNNLKIVERMGIQEEALEFQLRSDHLRIDVFFMYKINNGSWASGHRPSKGYYFRYYYPEFTLCSAELLQEKVQVPCEAEDLIVNEYGPDWMNPVSSWNYESSIHNRGPNIYWDKIKRHKVFKEY